MVEEREEAVADLGPLPAIGIVHVNDLDAVEDLGDAPGELAGGQLALLAEAQELAPQAGNDRELDGDHRQRHQAEPDVLHHDEDQRRDGLHAQEDRRDEGIPDEAADRLDLVLDDRCGLGGFDRPQGLRGEAQHHGEQVEAHAPQHPLAQNSLGDVDPVLERPVDDDEEQEQGGKAEQQADAADLEALEDLQVEPPPSHAGRSKPSLRKGAVGVAVPEGLALDGLVHDLARQIQGHEVERQGSEHDGADDQLVALRMVPDISEEALFHCANGYHFIPLDDTSFRSWAPP